ncbi:Hsp70 family protein [Dactylosporangium sp. McL0621]|uniref:Hsp70 family protein n=1 Tax=Dactylosporangium sp. McL0621 TaxID=3415678 RepID=UPI003CF2FD4B
MDGWRLGIDYGSSHTVTALARPDGSVRTLTFDASPLLSSAVYAEPGGVLLTGPDAIAAARLDPARFEPNPKRQIDAGEVLLGDRQVPVTDLIAATLRRVADEAARATGGADVDVVLTHPAGWGPTRRATLRTAAQAAGFAAVTMVAEPVAAARYFLDMAGPAPSAGTTVAIYDLGGGTFDISVVRRTAAEFEVLASDGLADVGGVDLDAIVVGLIGEAVEAADPAAWARLRAPSTVVERRHFRALWDAARMAKERLSRYPSATVAVPLLDREAHVTREQFERAAAPTLGLTIDQTAGVLRRGALHAGTLDGIFLVGGATRTPLVGTLLHRATGVAPTVLDQPELVVAEGALRVAAVPAAAASTVPPATASAPPAAPPSGTVPPPAASPPTVTAPEPQIPAPAAATGDPNGGPGPSAMLRSHGSRRRAALGAGVWAAALAGAIWWATAHTALLGRLSTVEAAIGVALLFAMFAILMGDIVKITNPDQLVVNRNGIYLQRVRFGRGLQRLSLPWAQISEAFVADVSLAPSLVVRTRVGPRDGAALTGRRYRQDVSGFALCSLTDVGVTAGELRAALAAHSQGAH